MDTPVACVDYSSLYPSSMISQNFSHDSKVWTKEFDLEGRLVRMWGERDATGTFIYDNLEGYEYIDIEFDTFEYRRNKDKPKAKAVKTKVGKKICRWAQLPNNQKSIMPAILEELLKARKDTRNLIKTEKDEFMKNILDKRQLGYKVTANSLYGQCGASTSTFYEKDVAACTTATGRMMITYAKRIIEEVYGNYLYPSSQGIVLTKAEYVYGDSVAHYTPVYVRKQQVDNDCDNKTLNICTIEELCQLYGDGVWKPCLEEGKQEKEVCELDNVETWTESGWTRLYRVIRHQLAPHKKIIRILTHTGMVDVTDDHSLLTPSAVSITPKDVTVGTEILHHSPPPPPPPLAASLPSITLEQAQRLGCFFGDESCGEYSYEYGELATKMYNQEKVKRIPSEIFTSSKEIRQAFWNGLYDACGDKISGHHIEQKNQISASHICWLASSLGYKTSIHTRDDKPNIYRITVTRETQHNNPTAIEHMHEIPYSGYVYDLTTENHHFSAGIGNIVVHNTDSVFFTFNLKDPTTGEPITKTKALEITIEIAQDVAHLCSQFLKPPMELSYEKTLMPFILLSKKRYVGMLYETNPNKGKIKYMGLSLKRRDSCDYLKDTYGGILNILMGKGENKIQASIQYLNEALRHLIKGNVSMDKLLITRSLSGYYKNPQQIAHWVLSERIGNRDAGNKPKPGDRVKYLHIVCNKAGALQGEKIETPEFILQKKLQIDYTFYITNQLMKPLLQLFSLALEDILMERKLKMRLKEYKQKIEQLMQDCGGNLEEYAKMKEKYCSKKIKELLFDPYLGQIQNTKNGFQDITKFFVSATTTTPPSMG